MKRKVLAALAIAAGLLAGLSLYTSRGGDGDRPAAKRVALGSDTADLWPVAQCSVWAIDPVATKRRVGLCVRTTESKILAGTSPSFPAVPELPAKGAERHSGWLRVGDRRLAGRVTCQVIDLREAGLGDAAGKQPVRLLVRLRMGGSVAGITGPEAVLAGDSFAAASEVEPRWAGDELHLVTVYTRSADTLYAHHVLVQQSDGE